MKKIRQRKQQKYTILIYCEGKTDHLFVKYLKKLYHTFGGTQVTLKKGSGGDPHTYISNIIHNTQVRDYDEKYIVLDTNGKKKMELKAVEKESQKHSIQLIWQKPCLEGVFLRILERKQYINKNSTSCKSDFYKKYSPKTKPLTERALEMLLQKLFTKSILDAKKNKINELAQLIQIMRKGDKKRL